MITEQATAAAPVITAPPIVAVHEGRCGSCREPFPEGDMIVRTEHGWSHAVCPDDETDDRPLGEVCTGCFTEISLSGECLC